MCCKAGAGGNGGGVQLSGARDRDLCRPLLILATARANRLLSATALVLVGSAAAVQRHDPAPTGRMIGSLQCDLCDDFPAGPEEARHLITRDPSRHRSRSFEHPANAGSTPAEADPRAAKGRYPLGESRQQDREFIDRQGVHRMRKAVL